MAGGNDLRYAYLDATSVIYCVVLGDASPSEVGDSYVISGDDILFDNGNGLTALAWTNETILFSNHYDDSLELHIRR